jgi:exonuclease SbcD
MRILHTSDWHLGRSFGDFSLLGEQASFVDWLVRTVEVEEAELVVIAGDLHDRAVPPAAAVSLFSEAVRRIRRAGAEVVAIAGNHDSGERIDAFDGLVDAGGVLIRGGYRSASAVTVRSFSDGPLAIVALPFLEPLLAPLETRNDILSSAAGPRLSHEAVLAHAIDQASAALPENVRTIALAHAFVTGAAPSDSERELAVGDSGMVSAELFAPFDYVALGHLHRPQRVGGAEHIRYSGSPLPYSFGELHPKVVVSVDMAADGSVDAREIPIEIGRAVRTVRGSFDELMASPGIESAWVRVELTDSAVIPDAHRALRKRYPWLVEIARVAGVHAPSHRLTAADVQVRPAAELVRDFWAEVSAVHANEEIETILDQAVVEAERETV